mgnify:CR=1 FL=1
MKRNLKIWIASILCIMIHTQCNNKLDLAPLGRLNSENFYQTETDFEAASLSPYSTLLNLYFDQGGLGWMQGVLMPDDDLRNPQGNNQQEEFIWLPNNGQFSYIWNESYKGIMRANVILDRLPRAAGFGNEANKARYEGEARFIRAYFYFLLANHFGTPPLVDKLITTVEDARVGNSAPGAVLDLVEADLKIAKANLPDAYNAANVGRATSGAATALLGKVYLYRQKYTEAATELGSLVGRYSLVPNFGDNFREATENNAESIFEIQMTRGDFNPWLSTDFGLEQDQNVGSAGTGRIIFMGPACHLGQCAPGANGQGYGSGHVTLSLQNAFEPGDPRKEWTFFANGDELGNFACDHDNDPSTPAVNPCLFNSNWSITGATPSKYLKPYTINRDPPNHSSNNDRTIRYADVLLMLAEARLMGSNDVAGAAGLINEVRRRADPSGAILPDRESGVSRDQMFQWLMQERRVELAFEGHRYNDLVRWHNAGLINITTDVDFGNQLAQQNWQTRHLLKPIPQGELDNNPNLSQNPGY